MQQTYNPQQLETEIQREWEETKAFQVTENPDKEKYYCLSMLPYPSGAIHVGHVRNYSIGDAISRFQRLQGKNVLQPMGWDAFGLPAENAAIQNNIPPARWTYANIEQMRQQIKRMGFALDFSREFATCDPDYYRWEQLMFTRLMKKGLAYNKSAEVNWDPVDQTVLANEQVVDGRGWRSGALVERREIPQWFLKITDYADELLDELTHLDEWPDAVKTMQRNWVGRSEGVEIDFAVTGAEQIIRVFTTRPDTLMGATYLAIAPQHPLAGLAAAENTQLADFIASCQQTGTAAADIETAEKRGMDSGWRAVHPISGEAVPVWVANFVLMTYGTGAVMSVPGHDLRDHEFAGKYDLPIKQVIRPVNDSEMVDIQAAAYTEPGVLVNSGDYDDLTSAQAFDAIAEQLVSDRQGEKKTNYRLRDWGVSRQRYWGCPIPVIYCPDCGAVPVPEDQLPVVLPEDVEFSGVKSPLKSDPEWRKTHCPECGGAAERETDTFDTFMESSWYYARYTSPGAQQLVDERADYWLPVDQYIGGIEHAILHLLYFRFYHKLMRDAGMVHSNEPAKRLLCQGMVVAPTFFRTGTSGKTYYSPTEVELELDAKNRPVSARLETDGQPVEIGPIEKMSKSKNNGVNPEAMIEHYGADAVRLFVLFAAPPEQSLEWSDSGLEGSWRFLRRVWAGVYEHLQQVRDSEPNWDALNQGQRQLHRQIHNAIAKVTDDMARRYTFNTAIAALMELVNNLTRYKVTDATDYAIQRSGWRALIQMLMPITPHISTQLWRELGEVDDIEAAGWPQVDEAARARQTVTIVVQINGKVRAKLEAAAGADKQTLETLAMADENVLRFVADGEVRKVIHVPDKLLNIVVK